MLVIHAMPGSKGNIKMSLKGSTAQGPITQFPDDMVISRFIHQ